MTEAETGKPDAIDYAIKAWRDAIAALTAMPAVFGVAMLVMMVLNGLSLWLFPVDPNTVHAIGSLLMGTLAGFVQGFFITPVAIAVHRHVLLGETTASYVLNPSDPRFLRFFVFTVAFQILLGLPNILMGLSALALGADGLVIVLTSLIGFALLIVCIIAALRLLILFPAIAIDAPGTEWRNAMSDAKGNTWRIFFTMLATSLPAIIVGLPLYYLFLWPGTPRNLIASVIVVLIQGIVGVIAIAAYAAAASRLYYAFGARLGRPPGLAAPA